MWYEDLNFIENPFTDTQNTELIGYGDVVEDLLYNLGASNIIVLEGKEGSGKTALLKKAINNFKGHGKVVYLNGDKIDDPNIENVLINKYGFFGRIFNRMPDDMILLMDEVENLDEKNLERIKYFYDQNYIRSIVFTSKDLKKINLSAILKDRVAKTITLKDLGDGEAYRIIKSRLGNKELFSKDDVSLLFKGSGKNVKKFLENCEAVAKLIVERKLEKADEEILKEVLGEKEKVVEEKETKKKPVKIKKKESKKPEEVKTEKEEDPSQGQIKIIYDTQ